MKNRENNSRLKWSKERVFDIICKDNLFGKDFNSLVCEVARKDSSNFTRITNYVKDLLKENRIVKTANGKIENATKCYKGKVIINPGENFAHIAVEGKNKDIYVYDRGNTVNGDIVEVAVRELFGKQEGVIINIIKRENEFLYGTIRENSNGEFIFKPSDVNFDKDVTIIAHNIKELVGRKIKIKLNYADVSLTKNKNNAIIGTVEKVYGYAGDPIIENVTIAEQYGFSSEFSDAVMEFVEKMPEELTDKDRIGTVDYTSKNFCTIDPESCKDIDDAIYVEKTSKGYKAYVALAHVSHYVPKNSVLDSDAFLRALSCYLGDGVYPMLPEKLSNGICSLNPKVDRRTICAEIDVDKQGNIIDYKFDFAIINSKHKLSYEKAEEIHLSQKVENEFLNVKQSIDNAYELSDILVDNRRKRGAIEINSKEPTFILNGMGDKVKDIVDKTKITSTKIIESLMILFNEAVGDFVEKNNLDTLFRVHEKPQQQKVKILMDMCNALNIAYDGDFSSAGLNKLLKNIKGRPEEEFLNMLVLRCLPKAKYQPENIGHFALASEKYIHSTAAIRRYSDIITQRVLDRAIKKENGKENRAELEYEGDYLTQREICADKAERESKKLLNAIWAEENLNKTFEAYISNIIPSGVFVKIKNKIAEIFIPLENLVKGKVKDYVINDNNTEIRRKKSTEKYRIGDSLKVIVTDADRNTRRVFGRNVRNDNNLIDNVNQIENDDFEESNEKNY